MSETNPSDAWAQQGLLRWEGWLEAGLSKSRVGRVSHSVVSDPGEVIWTVLIREGKPGWVHLTPEALALSHERFSEVTDALDRRDWYGDLDEAIRIRIDETGRITPVGSEPFLGSPAHRSMNCFSYSLKGAGRLG